MTSPAVAAPPRLFTNNEQTFPILTPAQIERVGTHGRIRRVEKGEVLIAVGKKIPMFFVLKTATVEIIQPIRNGDMVLAILEPGQFSGEVSILSGRRSLVTLRVAEPGELIEVGRDELLKLVQTDAELSEIFVRAFLLRRVGLIESGRGDVVLIGSNHSSDTLRIKEFLTRNAHPYVFIDPDSDEDVQQLLDHFDFSMSDIPVLICRGVTVLRNPTNRGIADCLGFNETIDQTHIRDVVIVGAGPAGLAAAVYAASEGLDVLVIESNAPGGQAGTSSRIENYLGFPSGISGQELTGRAYTQAQKFGANIVVAERVSGLDCARNAYTVKIDDRERISTKTVVIASGAEYRKLPLENISRFEGAGIYYGATFVESQLCEGEEVIVVGGGNSAGQAAVFLAQTARKVYLLVRSQSLADTMSRYLIRRIEESPEIVLLSCTEITGLEGNGHLEQVSWSTNNGPPESRGIRHVFVMTGAAPSTKWLGGCLTLDSRGFIKTGPDLSADDLRSAQWPLPRPPHLLETSRPGIFAVGDVRAGNIKRVASAVGEGSIAVSFVHQVLQE
ncbi:MAG TPA: FAD-dependent oxidoreductase [Gemmatimonadaceae bacterium]|nr:FAD-dependent oxidoreductase [Gemmatimonadaceae bacterium]